MKFFDVLMPIGRTNRGLGLTAKNSTELIALMDRFDVSHALVYHTASRDSDPVLGNAALDKLIPDSDRLYKIRAYEFADVSENCSPQTFIRDVLKANVKAIMVNPLIRDIRITQNRRINELAELLEQRRIPLILFYRQWDAGQDIIDWYELADFCNRYSRLPIISQEWRSRANRPMFDALHATKNLIVSLASIWQAQMIELLVNNFSSARIVFSLGLGELDPGMFQAVVRYANISEADKRKIAYENIQNIIGNANYDLE